MDKNAIKKYAVWARRELISRVSTKALQYGIIEKDCGNPGDDSVNGTLLTAAQKKQRQALIAQIKEKGYQEVMEEVAYTWFNRFSALRFMEVNGYLPTHVRVFTDEDNAFKPQIITEAIHLEMEGLDMEKVYAYKDADEKDELYKYLLIVQCNALSPILPGMFQRLSDYTELLFPDNLLREGSVIEQMIALIPEEDWKDAVQIIGWLYQYYNAEKKDDVFAALKKNIKITKENIPAATQLFTPDWIVRYMVENSLGRLWLEGHPNAELQGNWKYYLEEAEQEPEVQTQLAVIRKEYECMKPEDIKCIDPCCGSGHILAYLFDVLVQIYEAYGYTTREAVSSIVENNLYGLDIDDRAAQLAYFAVMMKARQYDRRFFSRGIQPHVYAIQESNHIDKFAVEYFWNHNSELEKAIDCVIRELYDAKEYGSILNITPLDWEALYARFDEIRDDINMFHDVAMDELLPFVQIAEVLAQKYDVVVTNPPYMGGGGMSAKLTEFVKRNYPDAKSDLSTVFMEKTLAMCSKNGYMAMINIPVWMFLSSYEKIRKGIILQNTFSSMVHPGRGIFGSDFGTTAFVIGKSHIANYIGTYRRLFEKQGEVESIEVREQRFFEKRGCFTAKQDDYDKIPGEPVAYWVNKDFVNYFKSEKSLKEIARARSGAKTGNNDMFLRCWWEVDFNKMSTNTKSTEQCLTSSYKWFPHNKGGNFRNWYGNRELVINFYHAGEMIKQNGLITGASYDINARDVYFHEGITWTALTISKNSFRFSPGGCVFDSNKGPMLFPKEEDVFYLLALLISPVAQMVFKILNPSMSLQNGDVDKMPIIFDNNKREMIDIMSRENVEIAKCDTDVFETSWDFVRHPLVVLKPAFDSELRVYGTPGSDFATGKEIHSGTLELAYMAWKNECEDRFNRLKANEEELNRIFIDIYGLANELTPEVEDKDVTVRKADLQRDIKSLISYAVGCMFGRYSLDESGLILAGQPFEEKFVYASVPLTGTGVTGNPASFTYTEGDCYLRVGKDVKQCTFAPDKDNIIPICDDEYFEDDIVGRFMKFIEVVYGKDNLDANLKFIADALGGKGQPKDVIRDYFLNGFYADHLKAYQKRPIYWLFDSGKKNGFKALIYMHRYRPDTIARIRTDYVHEQQGRYRTAIADLENQIASASTSERVKLTKKLTALQAQADEILVYEEKIHHLADQMIPIDLDDGVKKNYAIFSDVLAKIK